MEKKSFKKPRIVLPLLTSIDRFSYNSMSSSKSISSELVSNEPPLPPLKIPELSQNSIDDTASTKEDVLSASLLVYPKEFTSKYDLLELLGKGMQATVVKVTEKSTTTVWAAKIYDTRDEEFIALVRNESAILKSLNHPRIIKFKDFISDSELFYHILVFEYFESITLKDFLQKDSFKKEHFEIVFDQIYEGLLHLHRKKIIHRDFNINNILINPETLEIKIIDFGLAKYATQNQFLFSPHGNLNFRIPTIESLINPFIEDVWNFATVGISLLKKKKMTTRKMEKLLESYKKNPESIKNEKTCKEILDFLQKTIGDACVEQEEWEWEPQDETTPLENYKKFA